MKRLKWILLIAMLAVVAGCHVFTLYPFYTEKDLTFDDRLIGTWGEKTEEDKDPSLISFTQSAESEKAYIYKPIDEKDSLQIDLKCHLFNLGNYQYLDLYPVGDLGSLNLVRVHSLIRINIFQDSIQFHEMDADHLVDLFKAKRIRLKHELIEDEDDVLITAPTKEIQKFLLKYEDAPDLFVHTATLYRTPEE